MNEHEARQKLIRELAECIVLLTDRDYAETPQYVIDRYLCPITYSDEYRVTGDTNE